MKNFLSRLDGSRTWFARENMRREEETRKTCSGFQKGSRFRLKGQIVWANLLYLTESCYSEKTLSISISNISEQMTKVELQAMFCRAAKILDSFIPIKKRGGRKGGFAFVRFGSFQEAERAVDMARGRSLRGVKIQVQMSIFKRGKTSDRWPKQEGCFSNASYGWGFSDASYINQACMESLV
ncbi:hypothetical protein AAC387_Pa02g3720 [Persea americana]